MADFPHIRGDANASKSEAEAGVDNSKGMTPLRTKEAIEANRNVLVRNLATTSNNFSVLHIGKFEGIPIDGIVMMDIYGSVGNNVTQSGWWRVIIRHLPAGNPQIEFLTIRTVDQSGFVDFLRLEANHRVVNNLMDIDVLMILGNNSATSQLQFHITVEESVELTWIGTKIQYIPAPSWGSAWQSNISKGNLIVNNLTTNSAREALSAAQGRELASRIPNGKFIAKSYNKRSASKYIKICDFKDWDDFNFVVIDIVGRGDYDTDEKQQGWYRAICRRRRDADEVYVEFAGLVHVDDGDQIVPTHFIVHHKETGGKLEGALYLEQSAQTFAGYMFHIRADADTDITYVGTGSSSAPSSTGFTEVRQELLHAVEDSLTSTDKRSSLSANQGKVLDDKITALGTSLKATTELWTGSEDSQGATMTLASEPTDGVITIVASTNAGLSGDLFSVTIPQALWSTGRDFGLTYFRSTTQFANMTVRRTGATQATLQRRTQTGYAACSIQKIYHHY